MGQSAFCQSSPLDEDYADDHKACGCLSSQGLSAQEFVHEQGAHKVGVATDTFESEDESSGSEGDISRLGHLVLARQRVFSPHLHSKFVDYYRIEHLLGEGSYGNVYQAIALAHKASPGSAGRAECEEVDPRPRRVAAKCFTLVPKEPLREGESIEQIVRERRSSFERERAILAQLEHPHLVKMYECYEDRNHLWIVLELCRGGELYECIAERVRTHGNGGIEESKGRKFFRQMLHAASYLHANSVVHRDVKTENFLLLGQPDSQEGDIIKLCDFGTAVQLTKAQPRAMSRIGTLSYTAPEVYSKKGATVLADAWSLGVVLYVLLVGASPFRITGEEPRADTVKRIQEGDYDKLRVGWRNLSEGVQDLVKCFLVVEESQRLTSSQALHHPWMEPDSPSLDVFSTAKQALGTHATMPMALTPKSPRYGREGGPISPQEGHALQLLNLFAKFASLDALQQLALVVAAQMTSEVDLINIISPVPFYDIFFAMDLNGDGRLDFAELTGGLRQLLGPRNKISKEHLEALVQSLDLDCSGAVDWAEWVAVALLAREGALSGPEPLRTVFRLLDRPSGDGIIGAADLLALINSGATGSSLTIINGREAAHRIIGWWAPDVATESSHHLKPRRRKRRNGTEEVGQETTPALEEEDLRRLVQVALEKEHSRDWRAFGPTGGLFQCCQMAQSGPPEEKVLVHQQRYLSPISTSR